MSETIELAKALISRASVTPEDKGCQSMMIERLEKIGFTVHLLPFGGVENFWATRGSSGPVFAFAGHTDVVPVGIESQWQTKPFEPTIIDCMLYGRGAADMKGSLASMLVATECFVTENPNHAGTIGFLITSDEEGPAINGTVKVVEYLQKNNQKVDYCLVGEPSSTDTLGDVIKNGRRGSLNAWLTIKGKQGHIAYPQLVNNPIHLAIPTLNTLCNEAWDNGNEYFPATSFQFSNIHSGTGVTNVIPGEIEVVFNFRYSTETTHEKIKTRVLEILDEHHLDYDIEWQHSGFPFLTPKGALVNACVDAIKTVNGVETELSTSGGTSDGRFISQMDTQVVELGPLNATIHQVNECVSVDDLENLTLVYRQVLHNILA
jgi:succinyl-diaminopimelate desuccinylase